MATRARGAHRTEGLARGFKVDTQRGMIMQQGVVPTGCAQGDVTVSH
jgi:hypothetical protein